MKVKDIFLSLKERNFALYFSGQCISLSGSWIQYVAMSWLVYRLTGSIILLSTVALLNQLPHLVLTPFAGVLSDRFNKYKIILLSQILFMSQAFVMAYLTLSGSIQVWHILALSLFTGIIAAMDAPARQAFYATMVPREYMTNAIALNSATINGTRFVGPMLGGILISAVGEGYCFLINAISYIAVIAALLAMRLKPFVKIPTKNSILKSLREGANYAYGYIPIRAVLSYVAVISFFVMPFMSVLPALVKDVLGGDSKLLGYVTASIGVGAFFAAINLASRKNALGLSRLISFSGILMGVCFALLSFTDNKILACILCCPLGFTMIGAMAASNTLLQSVVRDDKRGRVMSFFTMCFMGMSPIGGMLYGWVGEKTSLPITIFFSGVIALLSSIVFSYYRRLLRKAVHEDTRRQSRENDKCETLSDVVYNPF
ncbi:MAG: MFS transporter [Rikenellaceae bacterium]